ncbi:MAG TPA: cell division protein FtsL [Vicinamibacteria bacterium]|nr:cell division protein FtsL [Vicinamibacteria bacterium]
MRDEGLDSGVVLIGKAIDNSQVVRQVDPRASRDIGWLLLLVGVLVGGLVLYAWPALKLKQAGVAAEQSSRERERLLEENRKLRLEKAALENLRRVETIAVRDLGLAPPPPERSIVVETARPVAGAARVAGGKGTGPSETALPPEAATRERGPRPPVPSPGRGPERAEPN